MNKIKNASKHKRVSRTSSSPRRTAASAPAVPRAWQREGVFPRASPQSPLVLTSVEELVTGEEKVRGSVGKVRVEADDDAAVEGDAEARRDVAAVSTAERRIDQVHPVGVLDLCVHVQVLVVAPAGVRCARSAGDRYAGGAVCLHRTAVAVEVKKWRFRKWN